MDAYKLIFLIVFFSVAAFNFWFDVYASKNVIDKNKRLTVLANPGWPLVKGLFSEENNKIRFLGGASKLLFFALFIWGFPKYIFS